MIWKVSDDQNTHELDYNEGEIKEKTRKVVKKSNNLFE